MLINNTDLPNAVIDEIVAENMAAVGLDASLLKKYPDQLTPSEARRVSIARAITYDKTRPKSFFGVPHVIIYDEPTAGLDEKSSKWVQSAIIKMQEVCPASVVVTEHDCDLVLLADRVVVLDEGEVRWKGTPRAFMVSPNASAVKVREAGSKVPA